MTDRPGDTGGEGAAGWSWNPSNGGDWTPPTEQQAGHGWAPGPPPPAAPRPGVVPLRPLNFGEVLDGAFTMIQRYPAILLGFSAAVYAVVAVLLYFWSASIGLDSALAPLERIDTLDQADQLDVLTSASAAASWFSLGSGLLNWLASGIVTGVITITAARGILGRQVTIAETWRAFRPRLPRLLGLTILIALIIVAVGVAWVLLLFVSALTGNVVITGLVAALGGIGMVVAMIFLGVRLALAPAALVLETHTGIPTSPTGIAIPPTVGAASGAGMAGAAGMRSRRPTKVLEAIRRSWLLVRGRSWRTFGILLVAVLIAAVVAGILEYAVTLLGGLVTDLLSDESSGAGTALAGGIGFVSSGVLQAAVIAAVSVLVYVDARMRTEGLDILLSSSAFPPPTGAQPAGAPSGPGSGWAPPGAWTVGQQYGTDDPEGPWSVP